MSHPRTTGRGWNGSTYPGPARFLAGVLLAGALGGAMAGCGSPAPELGRDTARELQSRVLAVSEAAAANDPAGSLKHLDELLARLDAAATSGHVSFTRHQRIKASIDAVRADLAAQLAAAEAARKAAEQAAAEKAAADLAAAQAAAAAAAPARAPIPAAQTAPGAGTPAGNSTGTSTGNGNGKSNAKSKGKEKGKG